MLAQTEGRCTGPSHFSLTHTWHRPSYHVLVPRISHSSLHATHCTGAEFLGLSLIPRHRRRQRQGRHTHTTPLKPHSHLKHLTRNTYHIPTLTVHMDAGCSFLTHWSPANLPPANQGGTPTSPRSLTRLPTHNTYTHKSLSLNRWSARGWL